MSALNARFPDENFSIDRFESVINLLERTSGTMRDTLPQTVALRAVVEKSGLPQPTVFKLLPEIYKYWITKRDKIGKPLCRKFWPAVTASDTNPHQVFR